MTLTGNSAQYGGGSYEGTLRNCIVYFNTASIEGDNYHRYTLEDSEGALNYCCITALPSGTGNITNAPLFVDTNGWSNLRLQSNCPCINAGNNGYVMTTTDLGGNPRIIGGTVDMGAYEFQSPSSVISHAWLLYYSLPIDGSVDFADGDNDQATTWEEWKAWTDPTNTLSVLKVLTLSYAPAGVLLRWNGETNRVYWIERAGSLTSPLSFDILQANIPGQLIETTFTDNTLNPGGAAFYRVGTDSTNSPPPITLELPEFVVTTVTIHWNSVSNQTYFVERATNLAGPYMVTQSNVVGRAGITSFGDTNVIGHGPFFYRIGVPE